MSDQTSTTVAGSLMDAARLEQLRTHDLPPDCEAVLEGHHSRLRQGDLERFENLLRGHALVESHPNMSRDVVWIGAHDRETQDEQQLFRAPAETALGQVGS